MDFCRRSNHPALKSILKYKNHPSINAMGVLPNIYQVLIFPKSTKTLL